MGDIDKELAEFDVEEIDVYTEPEERTGIGEAFGRGAIQGATFGFGDELYGAGASLVGTITEESKEGESSLDKLSRLYTKYRDEVRAANKKAEEDRPYYSLAGNLVGGALVPGFGAAKGGVTALAKAGAIGGGLYGAGASEADSAKELVSDVATGAAFGAAVPLGLTGLGETVKGAGRAMKIIEDVLDAAKFGIQGKYLASKDARNKLGQELIENAGQFSDEIKQFRGVVGSKMQKIQDAAQQSGRTVDANQSLIKYVDELDNLLDEQNVSKFAKEIQEFAEPIKNVLLGKEVTRLVGDKSIKIVDKVDDLLDREYQKYLKKTIESGFADDIAKAKLGGKEAKNIISKLGQSAGDDVVIPKNTYKTFEIVDDTGRKFLASVDDEVVQKSALQGQPIKKMVDAENLPMIVEEIKRGKYTAPRVVNLKDGSRYIEWRDVSTNKPFITPVPPAKEESLDKLVKVRVREGGKRNLDAKTVRKLKQDIQALAYDKDAPIKNPELRKLVNSMNDELKDLTYELMPELKVYDDQYSLLKMVGESLKLPDAESVYNNFLAKNSDEFMQWVSKVQALDSLSGGGDKARFLVGKAADRLKLLNPELTKKLTEDLPKIAKQVKLSDKMVNGLHNVLFGPVQQVVLNAVNQLGYGINRLGAIGKKGMEEFLIKAPSDNIAAIAKVAQREGSATGQKLSRVFEKMSKERPQMRKALLFTLFQNPEYRKYLGLDKTEKIDDKSLDELSQFDFEVM